MAERTKRSGMIRSSVVIAKLLDSEGFNDHVQNMVERYWLHTVHASARKKHRRLERDITAMCTKLTDGEKLILGKFISMHKAMAFQTGLRIGLTAFACKCNKEYDATEPLPSPPVAALPRQPATEKFLAEFDKMIEDACERLTPEEFRETERKFNAVVERVKARVEPSELEK